MTKSHSDIWRAVCMLLGYAAMNASAMDIGEIKRLKDFYNNLDPFSNPEDELSYGQIEAIKSMYRRHIVLKGW